MTVIVTSFLVAGAWTTMLVQKQMRTVSNFVLMAIVTMAYALVIAKS